MKQYVCTTIFAVLVNGMPQGGGFTRNGASDRGVRSRPFYSFCRLILWPSARSGYVYGYLVGFQPKGRPGGIPLLQYADDTTFFLRGSTVVAHHVSTMIKIFSDFSSLQLNRGKSSVVVIRLSLEKLDRVSAVLATPVVSLPIR